MTDKFGKRIDVGQPFKTTGGPVVLKYLCPYAILMERKFYCPFKNEDGRGYTACPMSNIEVDGQKGVCYITQELAHYNKEHGIQTMTKEVNIMDKAEIKEAIRTPDGNFVAVDDIVEVTINYSTDLYRRLDNRKTFRARIAAITTNGFSFDYSEYFKSKTIELPFSSIKTVRACEEVAKCL